MGKLMELYDGEYEVSVGDRLILVEPNPKRIEPVEVLKVGREYVTIRRYGREEKYKNGKKVNGYYSRYLCKTEDGYNRTEFKRVLVSKVERFLKYDDYKLTELQAVEIAAMLNIPLNK
jgi:hypothetical protein